MQRNRGLTMALRTKMVLAGAVSVVLVTGFVLISAARSGPDARLGRILAPDWQAVLERHTDPQAAADALHAGMRPYHGDGLVEPYVAAIALGPDGTLIASLPEGFDTAHFDLRGACWLYRAPLPAIRVPGLTGQVWPNCGGLPSGAARPGPSPLSPALAPAYGAPARPRGGTVDTGDLNSPGR